MSRGLACAAATRRYNGPMTAPRIAWALAGLGAAFAAPARADETACTDTGGLTLEEVAMGTSSVRHVVLRNRGEQPLALDGVELALLAGVDGEAHAHLAAGRPPVDRFRFPRDASLPPGATYAVALDGGYAYRQATGQRADAERPVRGGEPDIPDLRMAATWDRLGAVPDEVALVCLHVGLDLDRAAVRPGQTWRTDRPPPEPESPPQAPDAPPASEAPPVPDTPPVPAPTEPTTPPPPPAPDPDPAFTLTTRGMGGVFVRAFTDDGNPDTDEVATGPVFHGSAEVEGDAVEGRLQVYALAPVQPGSHQSIFTLQDAWVGWIQGPLRLRVGLQTVQWHTMIVLGSADTFNARFYDGALEDPRRLGEPTVEAQLRLGDWTLRAFVLPTYVATKMPTAASRRNLVPGLAYGPSIFLDPSGRLSEDRFGPQGVLRAEGPVGPLRLGLHALEHIDRTNFPIVPHPDTGEPSPLHLPVRDLGWTARLPAGPLTLLSEGVWRDFRSPVDTPWDDLPLADHVAVAIGANVGFVAGGLAHLVVAEGQALLGAPAEVVAGITPFQRDVVVGYRLAATDASERAVLLGVIADVAEPGRVYTRLNVHQRVLETFMVDIDLNHTRAPMGATFDPVQLEALDGSVQLQVLVSRPF